MPRGNPAAYADMEAIMALMGQGGPQQRQPQFGPAMRRRGEAVEDEMREGHQQSLDDTEKRIMDELIYNAIDEAGPRGNVDEDYIREENEDRTREMAEEEVGPLAEGSDGWHGEKLNRLASQIDPNTPGKKAIAALGLTGDPALSELWDSLPPEQRMMIVDVITNSAGMAGGAADIESEIMQMMDEQNAGEAAEDVQRDRGN